MSRKLKRLFVVKLLVVFLLAWFWSFESCRCFAQQETDPIHDWPQWMGAKMDGVWRETGMLDNFGESGPNVVWRVPIGPGYTGPSVVGNRLFIMDRTKDEGIGKEVENDIRKRGEVPGGERVVCLDATTGATLWEHGYDCPYKIAYPTGPRCTPTVDGDGVYTLGAMGDLMCFRIDDGSVVWQKKLIAEYGTRAPPWGYASHPIVDGPRLLVPCGGEGSAVVCFDKQTGKELWKALTSSDIAYAPLTIYEHDGERQLLMWHGDGIDSLNPETGEHYWHHKFPDEKEQAAATTIVTPRIIGNQFLISEYYRGTLMLEISSNPPSVRELYSTYKVDPRHEKSLNSLMTTSVVKDGLVYGVTGDGVMRCTRWDDGSWVWDNETFMAKKPLEFATLFIVENEDKYFVFDDEGNLAIAKFTPEGYQEMAKAKVLEATGAARGRKVLWAHPAFSHGRIFARNDNEVICVDLKTK